MNAAQTTEPKMMDLNMHRLMLMVLRCQNGMQRAALCYGTLKRPDTGDLQAAATRALAAGLLKFGTTNASAKIWSRGSSDCYLYLTKAGKAALRAQGHDYGSGKVSAAMRERAHMLAVAAEM